MGRPLTLISSNIRFDNPADGRLAWRFRKALLARVLSSHAPFVIGTQEGRRPQLEELAGLLPEHELQEHQRPWLPERMYPSFFVLRGVTVKGGGDAWLSETPEIPGSTFSGSAFPRLCSWVRLLVAGQQLLLVNTHLDYQDEATRMAQTRVLTAQMKKVRQAADRMILLGDFNDAPYSACYRTILTELPELVDPWTQQKKLEAPTHQSFSGAFDEARRIDWIFVDRRLTVGRIEIDHAHEGDLWPSDHFPVVCELIL